MCTTARFVSIIFSGRNGFLLPTFKVEGCTPVSKDDTQSHFDIQLSHMHHLLQPYVNIEKSLMLIRITRSQDLVP